MIPDVPREKLLEAMAHFDRDMHDQLEWEQNPADTFAIMHAGRLYPVNKIINLATGMGLDRFSGGAESNTYVMQRGFTVVPLHDSPPASRQY
jgi:hypothetical protein